MKFLFLYKPVKGPIDSCKASTPIRILLLVSLIPGLLSAQNLTMTGRIKFLALGDSYTIGEHVPVNERWPVQLVEALRKKGLFCDEPRIIAATGWRTDDLKSALAHTTLLNDYTLVSLLIGVNNYYQGGSLDGYTVDFEELLYNAIKLAGGDPSHVFVISIPDYGFTPFGYSDQVVISKNINTFNEANKAITAKLNAHYFYITDITRRGLSEPELLASDGLHPSGKMYREWVGRITAGFSIK